MYLLALVVASALYAMMSALMKIASLQGDMSITLVARYFFACCTLIPLYFASGQPSVCTLQLRWHLLRGILGFLMFLLYTLALERIPLQNAMVLNSSYLLFIPILMWIFMRQKMAISTVLGLVLGFAGIVTMTKVHANGYWDWGSVFALASGAASASTALLVVRLRRTDHGFVIVFYFFGVSLLLSAAWAFVSGHTLSINKSSLVVAVGVLTALYQQLYCFALKRLSSALVCSVMAGSAIFGLILDTLIFNIDPPWQDYIGSILILASILIVLWTNRRYSNSSP